MILTEECNVNVRHDLKGVTNMKFLKVFYYVAMVAVIVWLGASWVDIVADNLSPDPVHHSWNAFVLLGRLIG